MCWKCISIAYAKKLIDPVMILISVLINESSDFIVRLSHTYLSFLFICKYSQRNTIQTTSLIQALVDKLIFFKLVHIWAKVINTVIIEQKLNSYLL